MMSTSLYGEAAADLRPRRDQGGYWLCRSLAITRSAFSDALSVGFNRAGIAAEIRHIQWPMFYKSITTLADHRTWQDAYHVPVDGLRLYMKFQADVVTEFRVMSFKEI